MRREFERTTPEAVGISSRTIEQLLDALEESGHTQMHGLIVMRRGKICAEGYWSPFGPSQVHADHSLSKTYTATAIGICEYGGLLTLDQKIMDFYPEALPSPVSERLKKVTVRDLLVMGGGFPQEQAGYPKDWIARHLGAEMIHDPGTFWRYDSHGSTLLAGIVERVTGMSMLEWLDRKLFSVIGIDGTWVMCRKTEDGICIGGSGMFTTAEDNLRLLKLYMDGGVWDGKRILSEQFVREAVRWQIDSSSGRQISPWIYDNHVGYSYQMWMCRPEGAYRADGAFGQFAVVVPSEELIVSIFESAYNGNALTTKDLHLPEGLEGEERPVYGPQITLDLLFGILLPSLSRETLPEDPRAAHHLRERLSRLSMPSPWRSELPDWTRHLSDTELDAVDEGISFAPLYGMGKTGKPFPCAGHISMKEENGRLRMTLTENGIRQVLTADLTGGRTQGILAYPSSGEILTKVSCSAWFQQDGTLVLSVLWYETEMENRFVFIRDGENVRIEKTISQGAAGPAACETGLYRVRA